MKASTNPLAYCEGGFLNGYLKPDEKIRSILKPMTLSFGITALNELQELYNKKSLVEDGKFAVDVMKYINKKSRPAAASLLLFCLAPKGMVETKRIELSTLRMRTVRSPS